MLFLPGLLTTKALTLHMVSSYCSLNWMAILNIYFQQFVAMWTLSKDGNYINQVIYLSLAFFRTCLGTYDVTLPYWTDTSVNNAWRSWFWIV